MAGNRSRPLGGLPSGVKGRLPRFWRIAGFEIQLTLVCVSADTLSAKKHKIHFTKGGDAFL